MKKLFTSIFIFSCLIVLAQDEFRTDMLYNWTDPSLPSSGAHNNTYNEVWGFEYDGREYGVCGSTFGTHIFDVTDPSNVVEVQVIPGQAQGSQIIHRDFDDYENYLYIVADEGASSLQIADMSSLPNPMTVVYDSDVAIRTTHNIFIDDVTGRLYSCSTRNGASNYEKMEVFDISANPINPVSIGTYDQSGPSHVHDVYVRDNIAYCFNGGAGLYIHDYTDPAAPVLLGSLTSYPGLGYCHSGWTSEDGNVLFMGTETHGVSQYSIDVTDPTDLNIISESISGVDVNSIVHNQIVRGDYLYTAHYHDGVYVYNISDPNFPIEVAHYDTYPLSDHTAYRGNWGVYPFLPSGHVLVSDMQYGFFVLDISEALLLPTAAFESVESAEGLVEFTDHSVNNILSWSWDFGDSSPLSTDQNPEHQYSTTGAYNACLTVTNAEGSHESCQEVVILLTGIAEDLALANQLNVFAPNGSDQLIIRLNETSIEALNLRVVDMAGNVVITDRVEQGINEKVVQLNNLAYGVYLVEITSSKAQFTQPIFRISE